MVLYDGGDNIMNRDTLKQIMIDQKEIYLNNPMIPRHYSLEDNVNNLGQWNTICFQPFYLLIHHIRFSGSPDTDKAIVYIIFQ